MQSSVCRLGPRPEQDCKITAVCVLVVLPECDKIVHGCTTNKYGFMGRKVHSKILLSSQTLNFLNPSLEPRQSGLVFETSINLVK